MIRPLLLLSVTPFLAACGLEEIFNPGSSQRAAEYRASITAPPTPVVVWIAADPVAVPVGEPIAVTVKTEPIYAPPVPEPQPECVYGLYRIYNCVAGKVVML